MLQFQSSDVDRWRGNDEVPKTTLPNFQKLSFKKNNKKYLTTLFII